MKTVIAIFGLGILWFIGFKLFLDYSFLEEKKRIDQAYEAEAAALHRVEDECGRMIAEERRQYYALEYACLKGTK